MNDFFEIIQTAFVSVFCNLVANKKHKSTQHIKTRHLSLITTMTEIHPNQPVGWNCSRRVLSIKGWQNRAILVNRIDSTESTTGSEGIPKLE